MPALPYCVLLNSSAVSVPVTGIENSGILRLTEGQLLVLYSELQASAISPTTIQSAALQFHNVVQAVFEQVAVVPFRFPTWLPQPELRKHLQQKSHGYTAFLTSHANHVQMEARLALPVSASASAPTAGGTAYLRARATESRRLRTAADTLKSLLSAEVIGWRERETQAGLRLFALVDRTLIADFRERLTKRDHEVGVCWSGPWPATEFLESPPEI